MINSSTSFAGRSYPPNFLWGAAMSAHQVEGVSGGGENSDWWEFEKAGKTANGDTTQVATDHWNRFGEDYELASKMGLTSVRISLAWEKINPRPGEFNQEVLDHYRQMLLDMKSRGIRPLVTLFHGTVPIWFQTQGGWLHPRAPEQFVDYVAHSVRALSNLCDLWVTFNEPMIFVGLGYLEGTIPPEVSSVSKTLIAASHVVRAHRLATAKIHEIQPVTSFKNTISGVGIVSGLDIYDPFDTHNFWDRWVGSIVDELSNWTLLTAAVYGRITFKSSQALLGFAGLDLSALREALRVTKQLTRHQLERAQVDWIGVNHYTRNLIRSRFLARPDFIFPDGPKGDNGWAYDPQSLERILHATAQRFPGLPIIVTENGVADSADKLRPRVIRESLAALDRVLVATPPLPVMGYYHWSLTDNFEWEEGYKTRFGLVEIQYDQGLRRVPRPSFETYRQEIQQRSH